MKITILTCLMAFTLSMASPARADNPAGQTAVGAVYTIDNNPGGNNVLIFARSADGTLVSSGSEPTGGLGTGAGLDSQGALLLSRDGQWLLVCNAGSDDVSVFAVTRNSLQLTQKVSSGGRRPVSVALHDDLVYVLNAGGAVGAQDNISGFRFAHGQLTPLAGSTSALSSDNIGPAQVAFTSDGDVLVVTEKATSLIDTFTVGADGLPGALKVFASPAATPFGFAPGRQDRIFVSNAAGSSLSSYEISAGGDVEVISDAVPTLQHAACWVAVTRDNRFAYTANAASGSISGFSIDPQGNLQLLNADGRTGVTGDGSHPIDMALSRDSRYLYSLANGDGTLHVFQVGADGSLQPLGTVSGLATATSGLAAQ